MFFPNGNVFEMRPNQESTNLQNYKTILVDHGRFGQIKLNVKFYRRSVKN